MILKDGFIFKTKKLVFTDFIQILRMIYRIKKKYLKLEIFICCNV